MNSKQFFRICALIIWVASISQAAPVDPVFNVTFTDARTDDNQFQSGGKQYWSVDASADSYQNEYYERPTYQTYTNTSAGYGASQYFANLDIATARAGYDNQYLYVEINLVGNYFHKDDNTRDYEGLKYEYGFRFSNDVDGANGYFIFGEFANPYSQASWTPLKTKGSKDTNGDVGGASSSGGINVTKSDGDYLIDGYDSDIINDGKLLSNGNTVLYIRMTDSDTVQFALDYLSVLGANGLSYIEQINYLDMQAIKGDPQDPRKYFWNDKYTFAEAGDPYYPGTGLGNIYELDTIRGGEIPEPATLVIVVLGSLLLGRRQK
jgi:hypothetical protein